MNDRYHNLKTLMFDRKATQKQVADYLKITEQSLNNKLNGRTEFTIAEAKILIDFLNIEDPKAIFFNPVLRKKQKERRKNQ